MAPNLVPIAILALLGSGCASTHDVSLSSANRWVTLAQHDLAGRHATVDFVDSTSMEGTFLRISRDSVWISNDNDIADSVRPLRTIVSIRQPGNFAGIVGGALGGTLVGALIGKLVTVEKKSGYEGNTEFLTGGEGGATVGAFYGGLLGGLLMGALTRVDNYHITQLPEQKK